MLLVEAMFDKLKGKLGETFTLRQIQQHIEQERDRPLYIRSLPMNSKTTGYCVFLKDVDLIVTRAGLDRMLELGGQGHEMAHILLHKNQVPRYPVTLEEFLKNPEKYILLKREYGSVYQKIHEREAEKLGRKIAEAIIRSEGDLPFLIERTFK